MIWTVDTRIESTSALVGGLPLSQLFLKNDANFLWFILVPRVENIQEIYQLEAEQRLLLIEEIAEMSRLIKDCHPTCKLNVGALGNIVSQLHIHIVARSVKDIAWPHGIWQPAYVSRSYAQDELNCLVKDWRERLIIPLYSNLKGNKNEQKPR